MKSKPESPTLFRKLLRLFKISLGTVAASLVVAVVISQYQDWRYRARARAIMREMEAHAISPDNPPSPDSFYPRQQVPRQPVVSGFETLEADEAADRLEGNELVLGVKIGDEARAYPINMMHGPSREIFNDVVGGRSIAATW